MISIVAVPLCISRFLPYHDNSFDLIVQLENRIHLPLLSKGEVA